MSSKNIFKLIILFLIPIMVFGQSPEDGLRKAALEHMNAGRYGEAIDLLNKYISANPRKAEGYHLRGLSFEKREQYYNSVIDLRRARKLKPDNNQITSDLNRVIETWYAILKDKIKGHLREIAIDPTQPFNYLEIGKSHRWMEEWIEAEEWYDKYLARDDDASPDEIIRYSEILAKNNHIKKGEIILKKYVERYPDDWRLWSRYGYFTLWLGKNKIAKEAFENALAIKPFFKEAQDGLDLAKREAYVTLNQPDEVDAKEFPIDRFYRILRNNPKNDDIRFKLVDELIKASRIEEAYQQLQILGVHHTGEEKFDQKWEYVLNYREETYQKNIEEYEKKYQEDPNKKSVVKNLAIHYGYLQEYDQAYSILENYFSDHPDEKDQEMRYLYGRMAAWARDFDSAIRIMDELLQDYPNKLEYQLFRAQISVWNARDLDLAGEYLDNVLAKNPNDVDALISMGSLQLANRNFESAQEFADRAKALDPTNDEVVKLQSNIDFHKMRAEEERLYGILNEGREFAMVDSCEDAIPYYEDYLAQADPNDLILKEFGDVLFCAKRYDEALNSYEQVLENGYYYDASLQRAKVYFAMGDSLAAVQAFQQLVKDEPYEFDPRLYLGDSYAKAGMFDSAKATYDTLMTWELDSVETSLVEQRYGWIPATGLGSIFESFPQYIGFSPSVSFYSDNLSYLMIRYGARVEFGLNDIFSLGVSILNTPLKANINSLDQDIIDNYRLNFTGNQSSTTFKGHLTARFLNIITAGFSWGNVNISGYYTAHETDAFIRAEVEDHWFVHASYLKSEAVLLLYSPYLIDFRGYSELYRLEGYYLHKTGINLHGTLQYFVVPFDYQNNMNNMGNDFNLRIGKYFEKNLNIGYEYYYNNWRFDSGLYYSPIGFTHHAVWLDYYIEKTKDLTAVLKGRAGYVPSSKSYILSGAAEVQYTIQPGLSLSGSLALGQTSRDNTGYRYVSGGLSIYWNIY